MRAAQVYSQCKSLFSPRLTVSYLQADHEPYTEILALLSTKPVVQVKSFSSARLDETKVRQSSVKLESFRLPDDQ